MDKIFFVEDDYEYAKFFSEFLRQAGYDVTVNNDILDGLSYFQPDTYALVISDLHLDILDGIAFLKKVKNIDASVKTMILTGIPSDDTEFEALDIAIDYYLSKDTRKDVCLKYIEKAISDFKQQQNLSMNELANENVFYSKSESLVLDTVAHTVTRNGELQTLTVKEFEILKYLLENKDVTCTRTAMIQAIWGDGHELVNQRVLDAHVKAIRKKLHLFSIQTIRGLGYKWNEKN